MGALSDYLEAAWLNTLRGVAFTPLTSVWVSLHTSAPVGEDAVDWEGTEVVGNGYSRIEILAASLDPASALGDGMSIANNAEVLFPTSTAPWGTITHAAFWDGETASNLLCAGPLSSPRAIQASEATSFAPGNLNLGLR